ncbi:NAD(P)-binding domain-containing protein, partial [Candidatus Pelagibacter sp.]|nr:NAD(P)-binding domain-containing protein [Candidatus Pelagibacter sp.]
KKKIIVKNVVCKSIAHAVSVHTVSLILALTQNLKLHIDDSKSGKWLRHLNLFSKNTSVGVVGAGKIGMKVITYLITLGFKVNYFSRKKKPSLSNIGAKYFKNVNNLLLKSDIVTLHIPSTKNKKPFFDKKKLKVMKNKYLVNLSRGSLIDEDVLLKKLNKREIKFYATDVFTHEPPSRISRKLLLHPKVLSTAHVGGYNKKSLQEVSEIALSKINNTLI